jgi:hypothetical protein
MTRNFRRAYFALLTPGLVTVPAIFAHDRKPIPILDKDLTISTPKGYNWITQDDLQNTYDDCKEGACNF